MNTNANNEPTDLQEIPSESLARWRGLLGDRVGGLSPDTCLRLISEVERLRSHNEQWIMALTAWAEEHSPGLTVETWCGTEPWQAIASQKACDGSELPGILDSVLQQP